MEITQTEIELIEKLVDEFRKELIDKFKKTKKVTAFTVGANSAFDYYANTISNYFEIDRDVMLSNSTRTRHVKNARYILYWICRTGDSALPFSLAQLGNKCGGFNHATVISGLSVISRELDTFEMKHDVLSICNQLGYKLVKNKMNYTIEKA